MKSETQLFAAIHATGIATAGIAPHFSPRVETVDPNTVVLDVSGMERLLGEPYRVATAIQAQAGPQANVAIAPNENAAIHAARGYPGIVVIPPGEETARLGGLPLELLDASPEILVVLRRWGLRTFRDLAALPEAGLIERFGQEGARLRNLALGLPGIPLKPDLSARVYRESMELEYPVRLLEPLCFVFSRLVGDLCAEMERNGVAALSLAIELDLENRQCHEHTIRLPIPSRNTLHFLKLLQLEFEARPPSAPVTKVTITAEPSKPRTLQQGLFLPPTPEPEKLELTLRRLTALVGESNVGSPELIDTHRPGAFRVAPALQPPIQKSIVTAAATRVAFRVFRPPLPAQVHPKDGPPQHVKAGVIRGKVLVCAGPWRTSGDWWTTNPWARDDFDLVLSDGALYRLFREIFSDVWYLDGRYD
ncbi:MAG: DNA polymerase Y family protein [Bryobacterales bacterium]|nr:DNA polymerase Y family protein [Bryobacterales bacterium]